MRSLRALGGNTRGAAAVEYGLIVALIAISCIGSLNGVSKQLNKKLNNATKVIKKIK
jgi:Flp pilus assembly pilin Flp